MRAASRLLYATHASARTTPLRPAPLALLPPIPLYRRLLRAHRHKLRPEERLLGDQYIRTEFRAHRNVDNPVHIVSRPTGAPPERRALFLVKGGGRLILSRA